MNSILTIESTPVNEPCVQMGEENFRRNSILECNALIAQIRREMGPEPGSARLKVQSNPHDFGTYYDIGIEFNENSEEEVEWACRVEGDSPSEWDKESKAYLEKNNYSLFQKIAQ
jgi:hypothetical protein